MTPARLIIDIAASEADVVSGRLWSLGTTGIEEQPGRLLAGFDDEQEAQAARETIGSGVVEVVAGDEWLDNWREFAKVTRAGSRFVIRPVWLDHRPEPNQVVLHIDPGRAFGSGSHPTTRLVLAELERLLEGDERVLDVGSGSGLLGIGAARIGATDVDAIDIDSAAVAATASNARRNGVDSLLKASTLTLGDLDGRYDTIVANISAATLIEMADELTDLLEPTGRLILSGLLESQEAEVVGAFPALESISRSTEDGWACLVLAPEI